MSLKGMFTEVVKNYDLINHIITWGFDNVWRTICARNSNSGKIIVDLCCGTGELGLQISENSSSDTILVEMDFSKNMLRKAKLKYAEKIKKKNRNNIQNIKNKLNATHMNYVLADAANLPFRNASIDTICLSFSFRNLTYKNFKANMFLKETLRSLQTDGKLVFVETSQPTLLFIKTIYHFYLTKIVPKIGWILSKRKSAYNYLGKSAANFPSAENIACILKNSGFKKVFYKQITMGAVALHIGLK
jgi:demethylmenaquinone methyltransferase/2-methoxy-6-polyprenyl-1,4-benzoquinol methylase